MGQGSGDIRLDSAMVGGDGPVDGVITAPLVYAGQGLDADLAGRDLKGRIAVILATPDQSLYAAVPVQPPGRCHGRWRGRRDRDPGSARKPQELRPGPARMRSTAVFTVGGEDGFFLQNVLATAKTGKTVTATLSDLKQQRTNFSTQPDGTEVETFTNRSPKRCVW